VPLDLNRTRDLGALLSTTFSLYGRYFGVFAAIAFAVVIPVDLIFYGGMLGWFGSYDDTPAPATAAIANLGSTLIAQPLITAMHVAAVLAIGEGRKPSLRESFERGGDVFLPVLLVVILVGVFTFLGVFALLIGAVYVGVRLCVAAPAVVVENERGMGAIKRSWNLVQDNWWRSFGILIVVGIIGAVASAVLGIPGSLIAVATDVGPAALLSQIIVNAVTYSFQALTATLIFFDLRARKQVAGQGWGGQPQPQMPGYAPPPPGYGQQPPPGYGQQPPPPGYHPPQGPEAPPPPPPPERP